MNSMRALLAAIDFSDDARHAATRAALLAAEQRARLELLHVMSGLSLSALRELFRVPADAEAKLVGDAQRLLHELASDIADKTNLAATTRVKAGHVVDEILSASEQVDMLALGAHGLNPLRDLILGTTAERLLRKCKGPVLVAKRPPQGAYKRVLVPVDFSPHSVAALGMAMLVAPSAEIMAIHAFEVPFDGKLWLAGVADEVIQQHRIHARQQALSSIDALIKDHGGDPYRFYRTVEHGDPSPLILAKEKELGTDLIVIGKHGRSIVEETLLGSVTRHVLSNAKSDVLVVYERPVAPGA